MEAQFEVTGPESRHFGPSGVKMRLKGRSSFRTLDGKAAFKLKFPKASRPWGLKKMTLNNMVQDPTKVRETLAYEVFRGMGVPASKTGYAEVDINGDPYGLYLNLETVDDQMLENWFESTNHLYEGNFQADFKHGLEPFFEVDEGDEADISDLQGLIEVADSDSSSWNEDLAPKLDLDEIVKMWATEAYVGHWDGYVQNTNNFYVHSDEQGLFTMLPSGTDLTFYRWFEYFLDEPKAGKRSRLYSLCLDQIDCRASYAAALGAVRRLVNELALSDRSTALFSSLRPYIEADPRLEGTVANGDAAIAGVPDFLSVQSGRLDKAMSATPTAPDGVAVKSLAGALDVSWGAATTRGANPITGYSVQYARVGADPYSEVVVEDPLARSLHIAGLRGGKGYRVTVRATSGAGNGAPSEFGQTVYPHSVSIVAPSIESGPSGLRRSRSATFQPGGEPGFNLECRIDSNRWTACSSPVRYFRLAQGRHRFSVRQFDRAGNDSPAVARRWTVDTMRPKLRSVKLLGVPGKGFRLRVKAKVERPAVWVHVSASRSKPKPGSGGRGRFRLTRQVVRVGHGTRLKWARLVDKAGNRSAWKRVR